MQKAQPKRPCRLIVADDHELVRSGFVSMLGKIEGVEVLAEAADGDELVRLAESLQPDIVLTDIDLPRTNGLDAIRRLRSSRPQVRCVVISMSEDANTMRDAAAAGAVGYLLKTAPAHELALALSSVMERGTYFSPAIAMRLLEPAQQRPQDILTQRQLEILVLLADGLAAKEIAFRLNLSSKTIDTHRFQLMERLQLGDIANLTRYAIRHGLLKA